MDALTQADGELSLALDNTGYKYMPGLGRGQKGQRCRTGVLKGGRRTKITNKALVNISFLVDIGHKTTKLYLSCKSKEQETYFN